MLEQLDIVGEKIDLEPLLPHIRHKSYFKMDYRPECKN